MNRLLTAGFLAGLSLTGAAFAQENPAEPAAEAATAQDYDAGTVLASVNGVDITLGHAIVMRDRLPAQYQNLPDDVLMQGIVDQLVDQTLLAAQASADPGDDPLEVRLHLENERRGTLAARLVQQQVGAALTEAEIEAAYAEQVAAFQPAKEYSAAHILVATEAEATDVKAQIDAGGDFAALAKEKSTDPGSGPQGGSLGWFGAGQMVPEFETAVAALEPGAVSAPVQSQFGWHVIRLDEVRDTAPPPLAQVQPGDREHAAPAEARSRARPTARRGDDRADGGGGAARGDPPERPRPELRRRDDEVSARRLAAGPGRRVSRAAAGGGRSLRRRRGRGALRRPARRDAGRDRAGFGDRGRVHPVGDPLGPGAVVRGLPRGAARRPVRRAASRSW